MAEEKKQSGNQRLIIILLLLLILLLAGVLAFLFLRPTEEQSISDSPTPKIGYAEGTTIVNDPDALQKAVDEMLKMAEGRIMLEYAPEANSEDGKTFTCYLANAAENNYDLYFDIYMDQELTDEVYLSGLVRPGNAIREIELNRTLDSGSHDAMLIFTQVEDDQATILSQTAVTFTFYVN